jgi:hypothetical protein
MTGRHVGEFGGLAPTGRAVTLTGLNLERLRDGRIVEHWSEYDRMGLMHQVEGPTRPNERRGRAAPAPLSSRSVAAPLTDQPPSTGR